MNAQTDTTLALALALEGSAVPASDEIKRLAGIAGMLEALPDPEIDPRFAARLEARLMAEMAAEEQAAAQPALRLVAPAAAAKPQPAEHPGPNVVALPTRRFVVRKLVAAAIAAAMMMALPVVASASSRPGSPFFTIEQFRQNHAISAARGVEKAFVMERTARKWFGYAEEGVALGEGPAQIERILSHANRLQERAATLITAVGTPAQIDRMRRMLAHDYARLNEMLPAAPEGIREAVHEALSAIVALSNELRDALGLPVLTVPAGATLPALPSEERTQAGRSSGPSAPNTPEQPKQPVNPPNPGAPIIYDPTCDILFAQATGDLLVTPSKAICMSKEEYRKKTGK